MEAILLAGGKAERLGEAAQGRPKALVSIAGKPLAAYQVDLLRASHVERVIGRSKMDDIEMPDEVKPANSHVALNTITGPDGEERQIVRNNMPFGNPGRGEFGTYYIGYAASPSVTEEMLVNMFIGRPPGNTDRILDFSTALTGSMFFTPTVDFLDDPPPQPDSVSEDDDDDAPPVRSAPSDGSLGIGSLKGTPQ